MSLLTRVVLIIAAALLPPLLMQAFNEAALRDSRREEVREEALRSAQAVDTEVAAIVAGVRNALVATAAIPAIRAADAASCEQLLQSVSAGLAFLRGLDLVGDDGRIVCATDPARDGNRLGAAPEVRLAERRGEMALGDYTADAAGGRPELPVAYPVRGLAGPGPVLVGQIDLDWLRHRLAERLASQDALVMLTDRNGIVVVGLPDRRLVGRRAPGITPAMLTATAPNISVGPDAAGISRALATVPPDRADPDLLVSVGLPTGPVFSDADAASARGYALIGSGFLVAFALAVWMARGVIWRPVHAILTTTERWQAGDTAARVPAPHAGAEFGRIAAAINALLDAVAAGQRALERANAELEHRVVERTRQFEAEVREREAAQAQLQQAQKMEVIGQLTGGVAHDFNNLLTAIIGNLELAITRSQDRPDVTRLLAGAMRSADRGAALTQRMLAFGRRQFLRLQPVALPALLDGMAELLARTIGPAVRVRIETAADLLPARADPNQVELVVLNLVLNARDAMPDGGTVTIAAAMERVAPGGGHPAGLPPGAYVRLAVIDSGEGMDAATQARAFEPFFTTKPVGRGSGLGLPMVHGVVAQSEGAVTLRSAPGQGTTVTVWLPCAEPAPPLPAPEAGHRLPAAGAGRVVLLVDDDTEVAAFAAICLAEGGYDVRVAGGGAEALAILSAGPPPDLLVADLGMPGINGLQLAREVRRLHPHLLILIATGYATEGADTVGPLDIPVLNKPFKAAELLARVGEMLRDPARVSDAA